MVNAMVQRATSDMLIGPDWARNIEICDICNSDPAQAKDVVKGIKNRLRSRRPKVQLLALTLLETIVKNCGDIVHVLVAERELPREMVKISKKKPDFRVKEKILILINTWQDAFGGPRARYTQYFAAYQELLRLGAVFPQISESSKPGSAPPSYPQNIGDSESRPPPADSSVESEFPTLSPTVIENARGVMDVLAEMLNAIGPDNKEEVKQDIIIDLVKKCSAYKIRVVHLVNSTTDESLLCQGLALNDELQRILARHESISSGSFPVLQAESKKAEPARALVNIDAPLIDTGDTQSENGSMPETSLGGQLLLTAAAPQATNGQLPATAKVDLLSGDDFFNSPAANSLALVPLSEPQPTRPAASQQNILALVDMYPPSNDQSSNSNGQAYSSLPHFQQQSNGQFPQPSLLPNGIDSSLMAPQHVQSTYSQEPGFPWNGQTNQQPLPDSPTYGSESSSAFPPPPWEAQLDNSLSAISQPQESQLAANGFQPSPSGAYIPQPETKSNIPEVVGAYMYPSHFSNQMMGAMQQPMQADQMGYAYPQHMHDNQMAGYCYAYGYSQEQMHNTQCLEQNMYGLSIRDDGASSSSYSASALSHMPSGKPTKQEDKLFGDLVDITKFKPAKARAG